MESQAIRVSKNTHKLLRELAAQSKTSIGAIVDRAVEEFRRKQFWEEYTEGYARLAGQTEEWQEYQEEMRAWEATLADGLEETSDEHRPKRRRSRTR
jgi:hypothetical protein